MAGTGEVYQRNDGKWAFRVKASNGEIVATDGGRGYSAKADAESTLRSLVAAEKATELVADAMAGRFASGEIRMLPDLLDLLAAAGVLNASTAQSYKTAVHAVVSLNSEAERDKDVRELNVDGWGGRFAVMQEQEGSLNASTVATYRTRFEKAVELYRSLLEDPDNPTVPRTRSRFRIEHEVAHTTVDEVVVEHLEEAQGLVRYPFPLGDGRLARLELPHPLCRSDAERLSQFVLSLATAPTSRRTSESDEAPSTRGFLDVTRPDRRSQPQLPDSD